MKSKTTPLILLIFCFCLFLLVLVYLKPSPRSEIIIRLHDDQIDIQKLINAIAEFIIVQGYGYPVEKKESTIKELHNRLVSGDIDVTLELWKENNLSWYNQGIQQGQIQDLGVIYAGGQQYWIIPRWYALEKNIKTVFDMKQHWRDFANPEDPSKGLFFNCIFGWTCQDINRIKLMAYGLDRFYNTVSPISPEALKSIYESARKRQIPIFGYYWEPNSLMIEQDWYILQEPPYSEPVWLNIIESAANPETASPGSIGEACAFNTSRVHKVAHPSLAKKAPEVVAMLKKMKIDIGLFNEILFSQDKNYHGPDFFQTLAESFLQTHPDQWQPWVTPEAEKKILQALSQAKPGGSRQ